MVALAGLSCYFRAMAKETTTTTTNTTGAARGRTVAAN